MPAERPEEPERFDDLELERLFACLPAPAWVFDRETLRILAVSDGALRVYGYTHEEFLALTLRDLRDPSDVAAIVWAYRARLGPVYGLGIVLVAVVVFGPAIRPWYVVWGLAPLAAVAVHRRVRSVLAGFCAALVLVVLPDGFAADAERVLLAVLGALIGIAAFLVIRLAVAPPATLRPVWARR